MENLERADYYLKINEVFNGQTLPSDACEKKYVKAAIALRGKTEFVNLPENTVTILKALKRLGTNTPAECRIKLTDLSLDNPK